MKKAFVKPEMKCYRLRANRILAGSGCLRHRDPACSPHCYYNCLQEDSYNDSGGTCIGHCQSLCPTYTA